MKPMPRGAFAAFLVVLVVLHFVFRVGLGLQQLAPDLLLVAVLLAARELRAGWAAGLGLLLGLLEGSVVPVFFGAAAFVLSVLGFLGARSREIFHGESAVFLVFYLFLGKWLYDAMMYGVIGIIGRTGPASALFLISPLAAAYAAAAGLVAVAAYRALV
ncbi:hypothetical protein BH23GEM5_BH23GEM5_10360 [soil metagenome]|jgi:rod shape-determining protein MreD